MAGSDIVVIGAGVIGLSIAWRLAQEGASVTVIDRGEVGRGASWAAAGMLAPFAESKDGGPFAKITLAGLKAYPAFVSALEEETGLVTELARVGLLRVAFECEEEHLQESFSRQCGDGLPVRWLTGDEARKLEPNLSPAVRAAIHSPEEWQIEPRKLTRALAVACAARGVKVVEQTAVTGFSTANGRVNAVETAGGGQYPAGQVVIAGGAWSKEIGDRLGVPLPVYPVRGQILALGPCLPLPMRHTIYANHGYLVPKADGRVVVGATQEVDAGFDTRPTCEGVGSLLALAPTLVPDLASMPIESAWAGLRPAAPDGLPILGKLHGWENAYAATGHFRNGILLAPITSELMTGLILRGDTLALLVSFRADRFTGAEARITLLHGGAH